MNTDAHRSEGRGGALRRDVFSVAQVSKPAVPQVSKPAARKAVPPTWKSAAQQVWKPALRNLGMCARCACHLGMALYSYLRSSASICGSRLFLEVQQPD
jgi:hypothetical protein